jgi:hypothetical protein
MKGINWLWMRLLLLVLILIPGGLAITMASLTGSAMSEHIIPGSRGEFVLELAYNIAWFGWVMSFILIFGSLVIDLMSSFYSEYSIQIVKREGKQE